MKIGARLLTALALTALALTGALSLSACGKSAPTRPLGASENYTAFGVTVRADFPGKAGQFGDPIAFRALFPGHTTATAWSVGNLGILQPGSYEMAFIDFPVTTSAGTITSELESYATGVPIVQLFGRSGVKEITPTTDDRFAGTMAFSTGHVLVIIGAYDLVNPPVKRFINSIQLVS